MPSIRRPLNSLLSLAVAVSTAVAMLPAPASAATRVVSFGAIEGSAALLQTQHMAPASVLGLDGEDTQAAQNLTTALRTAFKARGLSGGEEVSLVEMRLTMGCNNLEPACLAEGGKALSVDKLVYGQLHSQSPGKYQLELQILDVATGVIVNQASEPISGDDLAAGTIDDKAMAIVNGLLGSEDDPEPVPSAGTTLPPELEPETQTETDAPPRESKYWFGRDENSPTWKKAGLGVGIVLAAGGLGVAIGFGSQLDKYEDRAQKAITDTSGQSNEIPEDVRSQGLIKSCDRALSHPNPETPNAVFNKPVGTPCKKGAQAQMAANAGWAGFGVGMAVTVVFTVLLLVHKKDSGMAALRRHQLRIGAAPMRGGTSFGTSFKF